MEWYRIVFGGAAICLLLYAYVDAREHENNPSLKGYPGGSFGISYFPAEALSGKSQIDNFRLGLFYHLTNATGLPVEIEFDYMSMSLQGRRLSYANMLIIPAAFVAAYSFNVKAPFRSYPVWILMAPQLLGNFRINLVSVADVAHLYIGQTTDYYLYGKASRVYTETNGGVKLIFGRSTVRLGVSKPWLSAYIDDPSFAVKAGVDIYFTRMDERK